MKKLFIILIAMAMLPTLQAQDAEKKENPWKLKGETGLTYSNVMLKDWAAGGDNSNSLLWRGLVKLNHEGKGRWENTLDMAYGLVQQGDQDLRKMNDKIDFLSKYSANGFNDKWRYMALLNFKSQFTDGFKYNSNSKDILVSGFFAPAYLTGSFGLEYLGNEKLKIFISPFSSKTTIVKEAFYDKLVEERAEILEWPGGRPDYEGGEQFEVDPFFRDSAETVLSTTTTYGLDWRQNTKTEIGALAQIIYDHPDMVKGFGFKSRLDLFAAYANIDKVDIDWEFWLTYKINKFLSVNLNTQFIYDDDIKFQTNFTNTDGTPGVKNSPRLQTRNLFGVGVVYTFAN
jgi:hypothetical protein